MFNAVFSTVVKVLDFAGSPGFLIMAFAVAIMLLSYGEIEYYHYAYHEALKERAVNELSYQRAILDLQNELARVRAGI